MEIKAVKFYEKGFATQGFVFGGEEGAENFDNSIKYRSCLNNYVIDTGDEQMKQVLLIHKQNN